jgi:hypothetical protein
MAFPVVPAVAALATVIWRVVASLVAGGGGGARGLMVARGWRWAVVCGETAGFFPGFVGPCRRLVDFPMRRLGRQWVSAIAPELMRVHF